MTTASSAAASRAARHPAVRCAPSGGAGQSAGACDGDGRVMSVGWISVPQPSELWLRIIYRNRSGNASELSRGACRKVARRGINGNRVPRSSASCINATPLRGSVTRCLLGLKGRGELSPGRGHCDPGSRMPRWRGIGTGGEAQRNPRWQFPGRPEPRKGRQQRLSAQQVSPLRGSSISRRYAFGFMSATLSMSQGASSSRPAMSC